MEGRVVHILMTKGEYTRYPFAGNGTDRAMRSFPTVPAGDESQYGPAFARL